MLIMQHIKEKVVLGVKYQITLILNNYAQSKHSFFYLVNLFSFFNSCVCSFSLQAYIKTHKETLL